MSMQPFLKVNLSELNEVMNFPDVSREHLTPVGLCFSHSEPEGSGFQPYHMPQLHESIPPLFDEFCSHCCPSWLRHDKPSFLIG